MRVLDNCRPDRQTVMFSATFPRAMEALARRILSRPVEVQVGGRSVVSNEIEQHVMVVEEDQKFLKLLEECLSRATNKRQRAKSFIGGRVLAGRNSGASPSLLSGKANPPAKEASTKTDGGGGASIDDTTMLQTLSQEWISQLESFGSIYVMAKPRALLLRGQFLMMHGKRKQAFAAQPPDLHHCYCTHQRRCKQVAELQ